MSCKVYVGNLSWGTNDDSLRSAFEQFGSVTDSIVLKDRETGMALALQPTLTDFQAAPVDSAL